VTSFADVAGVAAPDRDGFGEGDHGAIWTGNLPPQRFVEFPFVAVNPKTDTRIEWPAYQTYATASASSGRGRKRSKSPASVTTVAAAPTASSTPAPRAV
jgi:hypothetical protein